MTLIKTSSLLLHELQNVAAAAADNVQWKQVVWQDIILFPLSLSHFEKSLSNFWWEEKMSAVEAAAAHFCSL